MARYARKKLAEKSANELLNRVAYPGKGAVDLDDVRGVLELKLRPLQTPDVSGALLWRDGGYVIVVNASHAPVRQRFTIAHELGHFRLHASMRRGVDFVDRVWKRDGLSSLGTDPEEVEANTFAAALLMPRLAVQRAFLAVPDAEFPDVVLTLAREFEVSTTAMGFRLSNLGLMQPF